MLIPFADVKKVCNNPIKGIIHIGAHEGEERHTYANNGIEDVIWIEGNPLLIDKLEKNLIDFPHQSVYNYLIHSKEQLVDFRITNNSQSSSILELGIHKHYHPDIRTKTKLKVNTKRIDSIIFDNNLDIKKYNFVNLDIQGNELSALKSFGEYLANIEYIYTEVNVGKIYKKCALLHEMDYFLFRNGFERIKIKMTSWGWGDAFYIRSNRTIEPFKNVLISILMELKFLRNNINLVGQS